MTESRKRKVAILGSLFILCSCCSGLIFWTSSLLNQAVMTDPLRVREIAAEIADYTLPDGYSEILGISFMDARSIAIAPDNYPPATMIFLMRIPEAQGISGTEAERQVRTLIRRFSLQPLDFTFERSEPRTVNDQEVDLIFNTGTDGAGVAFRQMTVFFQSSKGKVFMMAQGPEAQWDQEAVDSLLDSIR